jgi:glutaminyl-peptide cyclotransferase
MNKLVLMLFAGIMAFGQTFDGDKAFAYLLKQVEFGPRNPNSKGHKECMAYLFQHFEKYCQTAEKQSFTAAGYGEQLHLANIIGRYNPEQTDRIILCAHWDTRPRADHDKTHPDKPILGASDGASGVAVLLEMAVILADLNLPLGIDLVLFDGEDYGYEGDLDMYFLGSRYFMKNTDASLYREGILLDLIGDKNLTIKKEYYSEFYAPELNAEVFNLAEEMGLPGFSSELGLAIQDDHLIMNKGGIPTINLIDFEYPDPANSYWHTHNDLPQACSPESLEQVGKLVLEYLLRK